MNDIDKLKQDQKDVEPVKREISALYKCLHQFEGLNAELLLLLSNKYEIEDQKDWFHFHL